MYSLADPLTRWVVIGMGVAIALVGLLMCLRPARAVRDENEGYVARGSSFRYPTWYARTRGIFMMVFGAVIVVVAVVLR